MLYTVTLCMEGRMVGTRHRTQLYLDETHYRYLVDQAEREGISLAEVVRRLIDEKIGLAHAHRKSRFLEVCLDGFSIGRKDGSSRHDDYIYRGKR